MSALDALLGRVQSAGVELELSDGLNFTGGLSAVKNPSTGLTDIAPAGGLSLLSNVPSGNCCSIISPLGPYATATARRAELLTSTKNGLVAFQLDTATYWVVGLNVAGTAYVWSQLTGGPESIGPTGTDYGALAVSNGLTVVGYYRADYGVTGASGSGKASWAPIAGSMSAITPDGSATNGIGSVTAGINGRAGLIQNGATQMGTYTAPALAIPGTTNWHRYWIVRQASGGTGAARNLLSETGNAYQVQCASSVANFFAYGASTGGLSWTQDVFMRMRTSYTGTTTSEWKVGNQTLSTGTGSGNTAPNTTRQFGSLLCAGEWLMYLELTGPLSNFHAFATAADADAQVDWSSAIQI